MPLSLLALSRCLIIGLLSTVLAECTAKSSSGVTLDEDLYNRALAHAGTLEQTNNGITERLRNREVEALYEVAKSMNDSGEKISSVLLWHVLADDGSEGDDYAAYDEAEGYDYEGHVPSAVALGFSYYEVDKPRSLHYFLMATSKKGAPHQAAMYNAGRLFLEVPEPDPSSALAYIRACANLDKEHPTHATPSMMITCSKAYEQLSSQLMENGHELPLEELLECFSYADINDFPLPNSKEDVIYKGAMEQLEKYMEVVRAHAGEEEVSEAVRAKAAKHIKSAMEALVKFQAGSIDKMSELQMFLIAYVVQQIAQISQALTEGYSDEL